MLGTPDSQPALRVRGARAVPAKPALLLERDAVHLADLLSHTAATVSRRCATEHRQLGRWQVDFNEGYLMTDAQDFRASVLQSANVTGLIFASDMGLLVRADPQLPFLCHRSPEGIHIRCA